MAALRVDLGVWGVAELEDAEEGGRAWDADAVVVFINFAGDGGFNLVGVEGVAGGVELTAEDDFKAAR